MGADWRGGVGARGVAGPGRRALGTRLPLAAWGGAGRGAARRGRRPLRGLAGEEEAARGAAAGDISRRRARAGRTPGSGPRPDGTSVSTTFSPPGRRLHPPHAALRV